MNNYQDGIYLLTQDQIQAFQQGIMINLSNNQTIIRPRNSAQEPLLNNQQNQSPQNYQNPAAAGNQQQFGNQGSFVIQPGYQQQNLIQNQYQNSSQNPQQQPPQIPHQNQFQNPSQNQFQNQPQISQQNLAQHPSQNPQQYQPLNQAQNPQNQQNPYQNNQYYVPQSQIIQNPHQGPLDPPHSQQIIQQPYGSSGQVVPAGYQVPVVVLIQNYQQGYNQYLETVPKLLGSYLTFTIACICLQLITCGAKQAASLWIVNFIFLSIAMALIRFTYIYQKSFLLYIHFFLMVVQFILEVPAFAIAVSHPPILFVNAEVFGVEFVLTQEAGNCQIFSDQAEVPSEWLKYWNGLQYANLIVCLIQFIQSFFVMYHVLRRGWNFFQFTKNQNPQPQPQPQQQ